MRAGRSSGKKSAVSSIEPSTLRCSIELLGLMMEQYIEGDKFLIEKKDVGNLNSKLEKISISNANKLVKEVQNKRRKGRNKGEKKIIETKTSKGRPNCVD